MIYPKANTTGITNPVVSALLGAIHRAFKTAMLIINIAKMTVVLLSGWILLAAGCSESAQSDGAEQLDAERDKAANQILAEILEADGGSGVIAAVVVDGKLVWSGAAGMADLEADRPMRCLRFAAQAPSTLGIFTRGST